MSADELSNIDNSSAWHQTQSVLAEPPVRKLDRAESGCPVVVVEQSPNPLPSTDTSFACIGVRSDWLDQPIA